MTPHPVVTREEWIDARRTLLAAEKAFTRQRDALSAQRRTLPWERVAQPYRFETTHGPTDLGGLFAGRNQLVVYHYMFPPEWEEGCKSCSFWLDNFNGIEAHLAARDVSLVAVSRAPLAKLQAFRRRMGWNLEWVSSAASDFNFDFDVSFTPEDMAAGAVTYNYTQRTFPVSEAPGISVFCRGDDAGIYHTYSCYARGLDNLNGAYHLLDLTPKGRDEQDLPYSMAWVRLHDRYGD